METKLQNLVKQVGTDVSGKWIAVDRIDQLANLIVKECIDSVEVWETDSRNHISYMLKQHFGLNKNLQ
jgi:hypothetical protein